VTSSFSKKKRDNLKSTKTNQKGTSARGTTSYDGMGLPLIKGAKGYQSLNQTTPINPPTS